MKRYHLGLGLAAALCASSLGWAEDWTGFRGPGGGAVSTETNLPTKWDSESGLRWKADIPGKGLSNPIVSTGRVYLTACSGYRENRLHVLCYDEKTGKKLWDRRIASTGNTGCHPSTNMAAPTPVTDGKAVYALFATADLVSFDANGNLLWYRSLTEDFPGIANQVGMASSPLLVGDTLIVSMETVGDSFILGIDPATGKNKWRIDRQRNLNWVSPFAIKENGKDSVVLVSPAGVETIDPATGKNRWNLVAEGSTIASGVVGEDGVLFVPGKEMMALKPLGEGKTPDILWKSGKFRTYYASPVYHQGKVYFLTDQAIICADAKTGMEVWRERVAGPFWTTPLIADGKIYMLNEKGLTMVLKLGEKQAIVARNALSDKEMFQSSPAVANGALFVRSDATLYCINGNK